MKYALYYLNRPYKGRPIGYFLYPDEGAYLWHGEPVRACRVGCETFERGQTDVVRRIALAILFFERKFLAAARDLFLVPNISGKDVMRVARLARSANLTALTVWADFTKERDEEKEGG